jgi:hypothetical protein
LQAITNTGSSVINTPYTLAIYNPSYALISGQAWNWGASGSATSGVLSGSITQVGPDTRVILVLEKPLDC